MDRHSYFVAVAVIYASLAMLLAVGERPRRGSPMSMLTVAYASVAAGVALQATDAYLPFWLHAVVGNVLAWAGLTYQAWAILALAGRPMTRRGRRIAAVLLAAIVAILLLAPPWARFGGANWVYAALFAYSGWALSRWREASVTLRTLTVSLFATAGLAYLLRGVELAVAGSSVSSAGLPSVTPGVTVALLPLSLMALVSSAFGLLLLTRHMTEARLQEARDDLTRLAAFDDLTGLPNRRYVLERALAECATSDRTARPFAIAVLDLDGLKSINDQYGHAAGDAALRRVAEAFHAGLRGQDVGARLGGDEFAVLLPDSDLGQARAAMSRVLNELRGRGPDEHQPSHVLTASVGVAAYQEGEPLDALFARADHAMYEAKRAGGGSVKARDWPSSMDDLSGTALPVDE